MSPDQLASQGARLLASGYGWSSVSKENARLIRRRADARFKELCLIELSLIDLPPPSYVTVLRGHRGWVRHAISECAPRENTLGRYRARLACGERISYELHSFPNLLASRKPPTCRSCLSNTHGLARGAYIAEDVWKMLFRDVLAHLERDNVSPHVLDNALHDAHKLKEEIDAQTAREALA